MAETLADLLSRRVAEGRLYERLPEGRLRCVACGHRCLILDGHEGICRVRFNRGGTLLVPHGYVGALQLDPVEKKPFFHALPGAMALSFGMLGCDYHCAYCFTGDTRVATTSGMLRLDELFTGAAPVPEEVEGHRRPGEGLSVIGDDGVKYPVRRVYRHAHDGPLIRVRPRFLPGFVCTPEHRILATADPISGHLEEIPAEKLTTAHYLALPRTHSFSEPQILETADLLRPMENRIRVSRRVSVPVMEQVAALTAAGYPSSVIGAKLGLRSDHVRHIRSRMARRGGALDEMLSRPGTLQVNDGRVRFHKEKGAGVPARIALTPALAELLGLYCAEGSVQSPKDRPNSHTLIFTFGPGETSLAGKTAALLQSTFGVEPRLARRATTLNVAVGQASVAALFKTLCGSGAVAKHIPSSVHRAPKEVARAFLDAFVAGDGHVYPNGKVSVTTVSESLAWDVALLALRLGWLPGVYPASRPAEGRIMGRFVRQRTIQYTITWHPSPPARRMWREREGYYLIPIRQVERVPHSGYVYDLEVDERHTYLANLIAVHNCQNWVTSQALRDPASEYAGASPEDITPKQFVDLAFRQDAKIVTSTYNEPLITSEWAVTIFREAKSRGLVTSYVSNGNGTREVLEFIRPWVDLYKVDLKGFSDATYRRVMGGVLQHVLDTIPMLVEMGFWVEIVTLIIPGVNDSDEELKGIANFLAGVSKDLPWHVTAFHKDYKMTDPDNTTAAMLLRAAEIGAAAGLRYIYAGNLPGQVGRWENTFCPRCGHLLIERYGFKVLKNIVADGACPSCATRIPGFWKAPASSVA